MSLLDAFKPKWQNSNPAKRLEAVSELDSHNQDILERIAISDEDVDVKYAAIKKLTLIPTLLNISKNDKDATIRRLADLRYFEEIAKKLKNYREPINDEIKSYLNAIKDSRYADELLKSMPNSELRLELARICSKPSLLANVANRDAKEEIALAAVEGIESENLLQEISKVSKHPSVRKKASEKLRAQKNLVENKPQKAENLLASKREALIQQAHHLAAQKDAVATKPRFDNLMAEAQALGMGDMQAELDEIYASFNKFLSEANAAKEAEAKAEAEKQAKIQHLSETLAELESIVEANKIEENQERVNTIVTEWNENKSIMDSASTKRFNNAFFKTQEVKRVETVVEENATDAETEALRKDLLGRLQALSETEVNDSTGKHLHFIVRDWEKLPLLEGKDPILQTYNTLRNKLSEKISTYSEAAQKTFEENSVKLRALIERVQSIDENEDFRDINKKLRETFQEWKSIVGEQKFKYHDLWQEYKNATSRFQEMQQWENWHNEKDRDTIIEEMEALAKEEPNQSVLTKLRELCNKWRDIGPISASKLQDYRDRFQALVDKVKENCASFINELNEERLKNLAEKEGLCKKIEDLVANAEIFWKDKFKAMQEIQESWKNIGMVPKEKFAELNERFKAAANAFYSQHKENQKQEDAIRESNYEKKVALCVEAEAIKDSSDWNATAAKLKQLQDAWKVTGPVPKSKSDEIWTRFRTACDSFFEKKRAHYEEMDASKQKNLELKKAICDKLESLDLSSAAEAEEAFNAIEADWKAIGMVPKEAVEEINSRYNQIVNKIVAKFAETDEAMRNKLEDIKKQKQEMIEKIRQFAESAGSNQLADAVRDLQKEWRTLGSCGLDEEELYKVFREACDDFFTRRRDQLDIQEQARQNNLQKKILLCEQAEDLLTDLNDQTVGASMNKVKHLRRLWKDVGAVPREQSDKIWKRFNSACDQVFAFGRKDEPKEEASSESTEAN